MCSFVPVEIFYVFEGFFRALVAGVAKGLARVLQFVPFEFLHVPVDEIISKNWL